MGLMAFPLFLNFRRDFVQCEETLWASSRYGPSFKLLPHANSHAVGLQPQGHHRGNFHTDSLFELAFRLRHGHLKSR